MSYLGLALAGVTEHIPAGSRINTSQHDDAPASFHNFDRTGIHAPADTLLIPQCAIHS